MMRTPAKGEESVKKLFISPALLVISFLIPMSANAASVGNPATQGGLGETSVGIEYDYSTIDMRLKSGHVVEGNTVTALTGIDNMEHKTRSGFLIGSVGISKNIDAFAGIGVIKSKLGFDWTNGGGTEHDEINDNSNLAWKAGVRAHITEIAGIRLGGMVQYMTYSMDGRFTSDGTDLAELFGANASYATNTDFSEWQAALTASTNVGRLSPYMGVTYVKVTAENDTTVHIGGEMPMSASFHAKAKNENNVGIVVGAGYALTTNISANIEGRFVNEKSGTASLSYTF